MYQALTIVLLVLSAFLLIAFFVLYFEWRKTKKNHAGAVKDLTEHIIFTRVNFALLFFSLGLIGFILAYSGYGVKTQFEKEMRDSLKTEGDRISQEVISATTAKLVGVLGANIDTLQKKNENITAIEAEVQLRKKELDLLFAKSRKTADSLTRYPSQYLSSAVQREVQIQERGFRSSVGSTIADFRTRIETLEKGKK